MKKSTLTLDINNLLCSKKVIIDKEEIVKITLFAIEHKLVDIMIHQNNCTEHLTNEKTVINTDILKDGLHIDFPTYGDITVLPNYEED